MRKATLALVLVPLMAGIAGCGTLNVGTTTTRPPTPAATPTAGGASSAAAPPLAPSDYVVCTLPSEGCSTGQFQPEPTNLQLSGDGSLYIHNITWSGWGTPSATGQGVATLNLCQPNCASSSQYANASVTITLSDPMPYGSGQMAYNTYSATGMNTLPAPTDPTATYDTGLAQSQ